MMRKYRGNRCGARSIQLAWMLAALLALTGAAHAAAIPFKKGTTEIKTDKTLRETLPDFFHDQGLEVVLSPLVASRSGTINGTFQGTYAQIWRRIASSNDLIAYYDGTAVYVYQSTERQTEYTSVPMPAEKQFIAAMGSVSWGDSANVWKMEPSTGLVTATGTKRFVEQVKQMAQTVSGLGQAAPDTRFKFYPLKYAFAADTTMTVGGRQITIAGVASVLRELVGVQGPNQFGGSSDRLLPARQQGLRGSGLAAMGQQQPPPPLGDYSESDDGMVPPAAQLGPQGTTGGNGLQAVNGQGDTRIVADSFRNAIIVRDTPDHMAMYDDLIRNLDVAPQMVEIEATIIDVNKDKARKLGVNWFYRNHHTTAGFFGTPSVDGATGLGGDASKSLLAAALAGSLAGGATDVAALNALTNLFGGGGQIGAILGDPAHFVANVVALEDDGVTHVLTRPQVITMSDAEAVIQSTETIYVPVAGAYSQDLYNIIAGTTLRVTPHVLLENGMPQVRMLVEIQDGDYRLQTKDGSGVSYPIVSNNAVNTQAIIKDGQGLLVGGLTQDKLSNAEHKIPVLGDIPILGYFFKVAAKERAHNERLFLITPRLIALNRITGQQTPTTSQVTIESQQQLDRQEDAKNAWWNHRKSQVVQPLPSPSPVPSQGVIQTVPVNTVPVSPTVNGPVRH